MTQTPPPASRRSARAATPAMRLAPVVRPLAADDFFAWVEQYAAFLERLGVGYRDDLALLTWQELGMPADAPLTAGLECVVADRAGSLAGFAMSVPSFSAFEGQRRLDVVALSVARLNDDGVALEALIGALHERAHRLGASELRWLIPANAVDMVHLSGRIGEVTPLAVYRMPVS